MLIGAGTAVYVAAQAVDMRKSIDGLALAVQESLPLSPRSGALFVTVRATAPHARGREACRIRQAARGGAAARRGPWPGPKAAA